MLEPSSQPKLGGWSTIPSYFRSINWWVFSIRFVKECSILEEVTEESLPTRLNKHNSFYDFTFLHPPKGIYRHYFNQFEKIIILAKLEIGIY